VECLDLAQVAVRAQASLQVLDGLQAARRVHGCGQLDHLGALGGGCLDVASGEVADGQGGVAEGASAGSPLAAGGVGGLGGEPVDLGWLGKVAEAVGRFAEEVGVVDEPRPLGLVVRDDLLKNQFGLGDRGRCLVGFAESGERAGFEDVQVSQAGG
jgi:hypothetical protein